MGHPRNELADIDVGEPDQFLRRDFELRANKDAGAKAVAGLVFGGVAHGAEEDFGAVGGSGHGGAGEGHGVDVGLGYFGLLGDVEFRRRFGFVEAVGRFGIEGFAEPRGDGDLAEVGLRFDDAVPGENGKGIGIGGDAAGGFAFVGVGIERGDAVCVKDGPCSDVCGDQGESDQGTIAAARTLVLYANFGADEAEKFGNEYACEEKGEDPEVERGQKIGGIALSREWPENRDALGLEQIEKDVERGGDG